MADPGGAPPAHAPLRVQILSFWHTNFSKCSHLGSWRPPTGNPGSATGMTGHILAFLRVGEHSGVVAFTRFEVLMLLSFSFVLNTNSLGNNFSVNITSDEVKPLQHDWTDTLADPRGVHPALPSPQGPNSSVLTYNFFPTQPCRELHPLMRLGPPPPVNYGSATGYRVAVLRKQETDLWLYQRAPQLLYTRRLGKWSCTCLSPSVRPVVNDPYPRPLA